MSTQLKNVQHDFEVPVGGIGVTVRLGEKWFQRYKSDLEGGYQPIVDLWQCPRAHINDCVGATENHDVPCCQFRGTALLIGAWTGKLIDLPDGLLALEHERSSRIFDGLVRSLRRGYGDISVEAGVTALIYVRRTVFT